MCPFQTYHSLASWPKEIYQELALVTAAMENQEKESARKKIQ